MTSITGPGVDDEEDTTNVGGGGGDVEGSRKIERKRTRERQRRSDLASAFVELTALVSQLDPASAVDEPDAVGTNNKRRRRRSIGSDPDEIVGTSAARPDLDNSSMTRLDLIGRTTNLLRRLQRDNADLRRCLNEERNRTGEDDNEVLVMIPTLTLVENQDGVESSDVSQHIAAYPPYYHQQQQASQPHVHREYAAAPSAPHHHTTHHMDSYYRASVGAAPHGEGPSIHPYDGCSGGWGNDQHQSHIPRRSHFSQAVMHPYGGGHIRIQQKSVPVFRHQREEEQEQEVLPLDEGS